MAATVRQNEAISNHDCSMVVTAGAGTGKTFVLVEKYLSLIQDKKIKCKNILTLTFTEKAASEMRERVRAGIMENQDKDPDSPVWKQAVDDIIIAPVETFHSFCRQILSEFAIEAGSIPNFVILDETQNNRIINDAFYELINEDSDKTVREALVRLLSDIGETNLRSILKLISSHTVFFEEFFLQLNDDSAVIRKWQELLESVRKAPIDSFFNDPKAMSAKNDLIRFSRHYSGDKDNTSEYLSRIAPFLSDIKPDNSISELCKAAEAFLADKPGNVGSKKVMGEDVDHFKQARKELTSALKKIEPYFELFIDEDSPDTEYTLSFFNDLKVVADYYPELIENRKREVSGYSFEDLIVKTGKFLKENQEIVEKHIRPRYHYILVDEFQDTDPAQLEIITSITGILSPDVNSLFIVGDPKQSIYLFRDADVTKFKVAQELILSDCHGKHINLDTGFRSAPEITGFVNYIFERIFADTCKPWEFGYEPIKICEARQKSRGTIRFLIPKKSETGKTQKKQTEALMIAGEILRLIEDKEQVFVSDDTTRPVQYGDITILLDKRTNLEYYVNALKAEGIPYYIHSGIGFYKRPEIYDIYNLCSFLIRPFDDVSLYGVLRSPYFSFSDILLHKIVTQKSAAHTLYDKLKKYSDNTPDETDFEKINRAVRLLKRWRYLSGRVPVVELLTTIIRESSILVVYNALSEGLGSIANLSKFVDIVRKRSEEASYELFDLVNDISDSIAEDERQGEALVEALSKTSVNIMTVHASKGLEFPVVILPDIGNSKRKNMDTALIGDSTVSVGVRIPCPENNFEVKPTPVHKAISFIQKEKEEAEMKRLLYVGITRARDHLILSGDEPKEYFTSLSDGKSRMDWLLTALDITDTTVNTGKIRITPDNQTPVDISIIREGYRSDHELINEKPIILKEEYKSRSGEFAPLSEEVTEKITIHSLSRLLAKAEISRQPSNESPFIIPGCEELLPEETGTLIHMILAGMDPHIALFEYGISDRKAEEFCSDIYNRFMNDPHMQSVTEDHCEVSFITEIGDIVISGRIDRLFKRPDGSYVIVDYKTGDIGSAHLQLAIYQHAAEKLTNATVESFIYRVRSGDWIKTDKIGDIKLSSMLQNLI